MNPVELAAGKPVSGGPIGWHGVEGFPGLQTCSYGKEYRLVVFEGERERYLPVSEGWLLGVVHAHPWGHFVPTGIERAYAAAAAARGHWDHADLGDCAATPAQKQRWADAMARIGETWCNPLSGRVVVQSPAGSGHQYYWRICAAFGAETADKLAALPSWKEHAWDMALMSRDPNGERELEAIGKWLDGTYPW